MSEGVPNTGGIKGEKPHFHTNYEAAEAGLRDSLARTENPKKKALIEKELANYAEMKKVEQVQSSCESTLAIARANGESDLVETLQGAIQKLEDKYSELNAEGASYLSARSKQ